jgi:hypothetical protein
MIGTACCFYKVIWKINIPLAENDPSIQFEARLRFVEKKKTMQFTIFKRKNRIL